MSQIAINKIVFLGPEGTYCEKAKNLFCDEFNIAECENMYFTTIKNVIEYVDQNSDSIGVVPIENSIEGIVRETMDNILRLKDKNLKINAETVIDIDHCLISKSNDITKIKKVISYTQALAQCQNSLHEILSPNFELLESSSTGKAVKDLQGFDETYAAIGSEWSAKSHNLNILMKKINDEPDNKTRFVLISRNPSTSSGNDKTSIAFATNNEAGALVKVLKIFNDLGINLCYIDSRPSKKNLGEYVFFADFEGHIEDETTQKAMDSIKTFTNFVRILGSFEKF